MPQILGSKNKIRLSSRAAVAALVWVPMGVINSCLSKTGTLTSKSCWEIGAKAIHLDCAFILPSAALHSVAFAAFAKREVVFFFGVLFCVCQELQ